MNVKRVLKSIAHIAARGTNTGGGPLGYKVFIPVRESLTLGAFRDVDNRLGDEFPDDDLYVYPFGYFSFYSVLSREFDEWGSEALNDAYPFVLSSLRAIYAYVSSNDSKVLKRL